MQHGADADYSKQASILSSLIDGGLWAYLLKAFAVVVCLLLVSFAAPFLPPFIVPVILIAYALLSTLGALYFTTIKRLHREYELAKEGKLSRINRKWTARMGVFFAISLVSGFAFLLEAPRWDVLEWVLTFLAVPIYFVAYKATEYGLRREFDRRFLKARAMKASFWVMGVLLCLIYAMLATNFSAADASGLREAFEQTTKPFADSPSALMYEADLVSHFSQGVTSYVVTQASAEFFIVGIVYHFIVYAFVFFGMVNQFGFCLLNAREVRSEFQLLPANHEDRENQPILKRYIVVIACVAVVASALFLYLDFRVAQARSTGEPTRIEAFIDSCTKDILYRLDNAYQTDQAINELNTQYAESREELDLWRTAELDPLVEDYYNQCLENVDDYLDWYEGIEGQALRGLKWMPGNIVMDRVKDRFISEITAGVDDRELLDTYAAFQESLQRLKSDYASDMNAINANDPRAQMASSAVSDDAHMLDLWAPLSGDSRADVVKDVLLNGEDWDREEFKEHLIQLIDQARDDTLSSITST